ncbi:MAG: hypothetical protein WCV90_02920 [Candidatus Woesearchaeota archaeon]
MTDLTSKVRKTLEEMEDITVLDEFSTQIDNPDDLCNEILANLRNHLYLPAKANFVIAPTEGIYSLSFDRKETLSDGFQKLKEMYQRIYTLVGNIPEIKDTCLDNNYGCPEPQLRYEKGLNPPFILHLKTIYWYCRAGTIKYLDRTITAKTITKTNKEFEWLFPQKEYTSAFTSPEENPKEDSLRFSFQIHPWLNRELYLLQKEQPFWNDWLKHRVRLNQEGFEKLKKTKPELRHVFVYNEPERGDVSICAFNEYFQNHPPQRD